MINYCLFLRGGNERTIRKYFISKLIPLLVKWWTLSKSDTSAIIELCCSPLACGLMSNQKLISAGIAACYFDKLHCIPGIAISLIISIYYSVNLREIVDKETIPSRKKFLLQLSRLFFVECTFDFAIRILCVSSYFTFLTIKYVSFSINKKTVSYINLFRFSVSA